MEPRILLWELRWHLAAVSVIVFGELLIYWR